MRLRLEVNEDTGEYFVTIPEDLVEYLDWEEGDDLEWDNYDDHLNLHKI